MSIPWGKPMRGLYPCTHTWYPYPWVQWSRYWWVRVQVGVCVPAGIPLPIPKSRCSNPIMLSAIQLFGSALPRLYRESRHPFPLTSITHGCQECPLYASASSLWCRSIPFPISNFSSGSVEAHHHSHIS